jgi:hypothetical protein
MIILGCDSSELEDDDERSSEKTVSLVLLVPSLSSSSSFAQKCGSLSERTVHSSHRESMTESSQFSDDEVDESSDS